MIFSVFIVNEAWRHKFFSLALRMLFLGVLNAFPWWDDSFSYKKNKIFLLEMKSFLTRKNKFSYKKMERNPKAYVLLSLVL